MKYWLDTEFMEDGKTIELLSIGIVCEDGREFYAENLDADLSKANEWVKANVLPYLWRLDPVGSGANGWNRAGGKGGLLSHEHIRNAVRTFCNPSLFGTPEFWGYYADYDWVVFCQLFGRMMDLPNGFPMYCRDIKQLCDQMGNPKLPQQSGRVHHALSDARWNRQAHEFLLEKGQPGSIEGEGR